MKYISILLVSLLLTTSAMAANTLIFKVEGMVCAFCAQGIEKNFNKMDEVKSTKVDLDKMEVTLDFAKDKKVSEAKIKEVVTGAGFKYVGIK